MKARERAAEGRDPVRPKTTLSGVPKTLPSLLRAYEISARAAAVGFDWTRAEDVLDKIEEEVAEVRHEVESGATGHLSRAEEEMGDLLFAIANLSRKLGIEPEAALRRANEKFTRRFDALEQAFAAQRAVRCRMRRCRRWRMSGSGSATRTHEDSEARRRLDLRTPVSDSDAVPLAQAAATRQLSRPLTARSRFAPDRRYERRHTRSIKNADRRIRHISHSLLT